MKNYRVILVALLIGITIFSAFKYVSSLKERYDLISAVKQMKDEVASLEGEKQLLSQELGQEKDFKEQLNTENVVLKQSLQASEDKLLKLSSDFVLVQNELEQLSSQLAALKEDNFLLKEEKDNLNVQISQVTQERDNFQTRLSSIAELKKAIRDLKRQMRKVNVEIEEKIRYNRVTEGNRGFIIKDGKATYPARIKIEVIPAPPAKKSSSLVEEPAS